MVVHSVKNQYPGINAHLHSYWQAVGGWSEFHTNHLTDLMRALRPILLPLGYDAGLERSLQIRRIDDQGDVQYPQSDVTVYDLNPAPIRRSTPQPAGTAERVMAIPDALYGEPLSQRTYSAIKIYEIVPSRTNPGEPVVWIELLSPSNKPGGRDAQEYFDERLAIIENGIAFVEIDYLHEAPSTLRGLPRYRVRRGQEAEQGARAYRILLIDPHPDLQHGIVRVTEFDVDAPIPTIRIPLSGDDSLEFDFGAPYQKTLTETLYSLSLADYSQLLQNFERYSPADQTRIARRMLAVLQAARDGIDLESGPFPIEELELDDALHHIGMHKSS